MSVFTRSMVTFCVLICLIGIVSASSVIPSANTYDPSNELSPFFYATRCPLAVQIVRAAITTAVWKDPRLGASLLRLHFHDCFVQVSLRIV